MKIKPFNAYRPTSKQAATVSCPPYDVVDTAQAKALSAGKPESFLHVTRAEIDAPEGTDGSDPQVYDLARKNLETSIEKGWLQRDKQPGLYLYRQSIGSHTQTGLVTLCSTAEYDQGLIKKHEHTRAKAEADRTRHVRTLQAQTGPVFLTYRQQEPLAKLMEEDTSRAPEFDFTDEQGVRHCGWTITQPERYVAAFENVPESYIADGHHRAASAANVARDQSTTPGQTGWFLCTLFPQTDLAILAYNRCLHELNGLSPQAFLEEVAKHFSLTKDVGSVPGQPGTIHLYLDHTWYGLTPLAPAPGNPSADLDVSRLQHELLEPVLDISNPREDPRISFIGGHNSVDELVARVDDGRAVAAFSVYPTTIDQLLSVADAHQVMPPKSTWFEPKLRSGLYVHCFSSTEK